MKSGFTLIEIIIVIALLGLIFGLTTFIGMDTYQGSSFRNDRDALIGVLQRARNQSMNNTCLGGCTNSVQHGVHITMGSYIIFQGSSYATRNPAVDEIIPSGPHMNIIPGGFDDVIFSQLSGEAITVPSGIWTLTLSDGTVHTSTITINSAGQITWTN